MRSVQVDLEFFERRHRSRGQAIAADLVAAARCLLEQRDRSATARGTHRRGGTGRAAADDDHIALFHVQSCRKSRENENRARSSGRGLTGVPQRSSAVA